MDKTVNSLVEGMERLGLIASRIRRNEGRTPQIEIDIILEELRNLYMVALQLEATESASLAKEVTFSTEEVSSAAKAAEEKRLAEEAAAKKAAEEKRLAEEAAAKKAAEEKRLAEEAAAKKAAEEKRLAEEAAAKKAAEERRLAEEAAAKKAAEEKRLAEEAAAKKAAEEKARKIVEDEFHPTFAPATTEQQIEPIIEPQLEQLAGNPNDELFAEQNGEKQESLLDLFQNEKRTEQTKVRTLADTLNQHQRNVEEQLENRVHAKKVDDLRTIININDKFSFMSELFHNNMKAYNDFILRLNAYTNREEALAFVSEIATQNNWDANSVVVKGFYKIFDRKF